MSRFTGVLHGEYVPPKNTGRRVPRQAVACPDCDAAVGQPCKTTTGTVKTRVHTSRLRISARLDNEHRFGLD